MVNEFTHRAVVLQPGVGVELTARRRHARHQLADGAGELSLIEAQLDQFSVQPNGAHGLERHMFNCHRARTQHFHAIDINRVEIGGLNRTIGINARLGVHHQRAKTLCGLFPLWIQLRRQQISLARDDLFDALRQRRPLLARHLEVAPEVSEGPLAHPVGGAQRLDQAVGVVGLAGAAALDSGASYEHWRTL